MSYSLKIPKWGVYRGLYMGTTIGAIEGRILGVQTVAHMEI